MKLKVFFYSAIPYLILMFFFQFQGLCQPFSEIKKRHLKKDLALFNRAIECHPMYFTVKDDSSFIGVLDSIERATDGTLDQLEFFKLLTWAANNLGLEEINIYPFFNEFDDYLNQRGRLPFSVIYDKNNVCTIISVDPKLQRAQPGCIIKAINGYSITTIYNDSQSYIRGVSDATRRRYFSDYFELLVLLQFYPETNFYVEFEQVDSWIDQIELVTQDELQHRINSDSTLLSALNNPPKWTPFDYSLEDAGIARISFKSFEDLLEPGKRTFLDSLFLQVKADSINALIIDLRGFSSGDPVELAGFCHYISHNDFTVIDSSLLSISQAFREQFLGEGQRWMKKEIYQDGDLIDKEVTMVETGLSGIKIQKREDYFNRNLLMEHEYFGDVYFLIDQYTSGFSSLCAAAAYSYNWGVLIGSTIEGSNCYTMRTRHRLNKSRLFLSVPSQVLFAKSNAQKKSMVQPHVWYQINALELVSQRDTHLEFALNLIKKIRERKKSD